MTPKFVQLHRWTGKTLISPQDELMLNPRRIDYFKPHTPPTQQPTLDCGTYIALGSKQHVIVRESVSEIVKLLSKK